MPENTTSTMPVPVTRVPTIEDKGKRFSLKERIMIGLIFVSGILDARTIADYFGCSVQYVRHLGRFADSFFDTIPETVYSTITLTPLLIDRAVISLSVECQASLEDVCRAVKSIFNYHLSVQTVGRIRKKYAARAREFNNSVLLDKIWVACSDEIFFGQVPVLASIDPQSTFVLDIAITEDRKGSTWQEFMLTLMTRQLLDLKLSISDAGAGLLNGIKAAFEGKCHIQKDLFHNLKELGTPLYGLERSAYAELSVYYEKKAALLGPRPRQSTAEKVAQMELSMDATLDRVDSLMICFQWIRELLGFTHYTKKETEELILWCLSEMKAMSEGFRKVSNAIRVFEKRLPESLAYLDFMYSLMDGLAEDLGIDKEVLRLMYRVEAYPKDSEEYRFMSRRIDKKLGNRREEVQKALNAVVDSIVRSSSIVENLNSRLRTAFNDMRGMNDDFLELLHCYYNTKEYRRSFKKERVGKSPLELYNGDTRRFFDIIMPEWNEIA